MSGPLDKIRNRIGSRRTNSILESIRASSDFASQQRRSEPDLPEDLDPEQIARLQQKQAEEATPFLFKVLRTPTRLLFGESIKAGIKSVADGGGVGDFIKNVLASSPMSLIWDTVFNDILGREGAWADTYRDVEEIDLLESLGAIDDDTGPIARMGMAVVAGIITDPASIWTPYAKIAGANARTVALAANKSRLVQEVEAGARALLTFKVPLRANQFVIHMPKSLDLPTARILGGAADLFNSMSLTRGLARKFGGSGLASHLGTNETGKPVTLISGERARSSEASARKAMEETQRKFLFGATDDLKALDADAANLFVPAMNSFLKSDVGRLALKDPDIADFVAMVTELGITSFDDLASVDRMIWTGRARQVAKANRSVLLSSDYGKALLADIFGSDIKKSARALKRWVRDHPRTALPDEVMDLARERKLQDIFRRGIDTDENVVLDAFDRGLLEEARRLADSPDEAHRLLSGVSPTVIEQAHDVASEALGHPSAIAQQAMESAKASPRTAQVLFEAKVDQMALIRRVLKREDVDTEALMTMVAGGRDMMSTVAKVDIANGLMQGSIELYLPRTGTPEGMKMIHERLMSFFKSGGAGIKTDLAQNYFKHRTMDDFTTMEVRSIFSELGHRNSAFVKLSDLPPAERAEGVLAAIFDSEFLMKLKGVDPSAADFFYANPLYSWMQRIESSARQHGKIAYLGEILAEDSPFHLRPQKMVKDLTAEDIQRVVMEGSEMLVAKKAPNGKYVGDLRPLPPGEAIGSYVSAQKSTARYALQNELDDFIDEAIENGGSATDALMDMYWDTTKARSQTHVPKTKLGVSLQQSERTLEAINQKLAGVGKGAARDELVMAKERALWRRDAMKEVLEERIAKQRELVQSIVDTKKSGRGARQEIKELMTAKLAGDEYSDLVHAVMQMERSGVLPITQFAKDPALLGKIQSLFPDAQVTFMARDHAEGIFGKKGILAGLFRADPFAGNSLMAIFDRLTHFFKGSVTIPSLAARFRDQVSNWVSMMQWGVIKPRDGANIIRAISDQNGLRSAMRAAWEGSDIPSGQIVSEATGEAISYADFARMMQSNGISFSGWMRDEFVMGASDAMNLTKGDAGKLHRALNPFKRAGGKIVSGYENFLGKAADWSEKLDNFSRQVGVLTQFHRGVPLDEAIANVRRSVYSPTHMLTSTERHYMARMIPFYRFQRWAVENTVSLITENPRQMALIEKGYRDASTLIDATPAERDRLLPEFASRQFGIPYKLGPDGDPKFFVLGGYIPLGAVVPMAEGFRGLFKDPMETVDYVGGLLHPLPQDMLQRMFNHSFLTGQEYDRPGYIHERFGVPMPGAVAKTLDSFRFLSDLDRWNMVNIHDFAGPVDRDSNLTGWERTLRFITGLRSYDSRAEVSLEREGFELGLERSKLRSALKRAMVKDRSTTDWAISSLQEKIRANEARQRTRVSLLQKIRESQNGRDQ